MTKKLRQILTVLALPLCASAAASDDHLLYHDRFHNGWGTWAWVPYYSTNNPTSSGTNSICIVPSGTWQAINLRHGDLDLRLYNRLSFWINGGTNGGQALQVQMSCNDAGSYPRVDIGFKAPTNSWRQVNLNLTTLGVAGKTNLNGVQIWASFGSVQPPVYVDDIRLVASAPPSQVKVTVNAAKTLRSVDPRIFGINTAAWDGYLDTASTRTVLTELDNQVLRWPGGSWGDSYFMTNEFRGWGSYTTNFIRVATNTSAQVYFIVNYGSGTPQQAADWVRFCNVTNKCGFKYWEVGNENFGSWEEDRNTNAPYRPHDAWSYALRFKEYYQQMKAVDPTIRIGAVGTTDEDSYANYTDRTVVNPRTAQAHNGWTPVMLATLRSNNVTPDFFVQHKYVGDNGDLQNLLWTSTWAKDAASMRQMLTDYLGPASTNMEIVCTEHGAGGDKQRVSLVGGLFWADSIGQVLRTEINALLWWDLRNGRGAITNPDPALYGWRTNASGFYYDEGIVYNHAEATNRYPAFYCAKLVSRFARGGDAVLAATNDYLLLSAHAVRRQNGALTLLVVNKSAAASLNTAISWSGFKAHTNATVWSYGVPQDEAARTGVGSPDVAQTNALAGRTNLTMTFAPYSATVLQLPPEPPTLTTRAVAPGSVVVEIQGQSGSRYVLESSINWTAWNAVWTNTLAGDSASYTNIPTGTIRFWRARWQP